MKFKQFFIICLIFVTLISIASVSASDNVTVGDDLATPEGVTELGDNLQTVSEDVAQSEMLSDAQDERNSTEAIIEIPEVMYKDDFYTDMIRVGLPVDAEGNLVVKLNDTDYYSTNIDSSALVVNNLKHVNIVLDGDTIPYGTYLVNVTFNGNYNFTKASDLDVTYVLDLFDEKIIYGSDKTEIDIHSNWKGKLNVTIDGVAYEAYEQTNPIERTFIRLNPQLAMGNHTVVVTYYGDKNYPVKTISKNVTVYGKIVIPEDSLKGDIISLTLPADAKGNLLVYIESSSKSEVFANVTLVNGKASVKFDNINMGHYAISAKYTGSDYTVEDESGHLDINPAFSCPSLLLIGDKKYVSVNVPGKNGELVCYFDFDGEEKTLRKTLVNGKASILIPSGDSCYRVMLTARFLEKDSKGKTVNSYSQLFEFDIDYPTITAVSNSVQYGSGYYLKVTHNKKALANKVITLKINGKSIKAKTNKNGIAGFKMDQPPKKYVVRIFYQGVAYSDKTVAVKHILTLSTVKVKKTAANLVLKASLKKVNGKYLKGKTITFKFGGKKFIAKTNKYGVAKVILKKQYLTNLKVGKTVWYQATYVRDSVVKSAKVIY